MVETLSHHPAYVQSFLVKLELNEREIKGIFVKRFLRKLILVSVGDF